MSEILFTVALLLFLSLPVGLVTGIVLTLLKFYGRADGVFFLTMIAALVAPLCALAGHWQYLNYGPPAGPEAVGSGLWVGFTLIGGALTFAACATARYVIDGKPTNRPPNPE